MEITSPCIVEFLTNNNNLSEFCQLQPLALERNHHLASNIIYMHIIKKGWVFRGVGDGSKHAHWQAVH